MQSMVRPKSHWSPSCLAILPGSLRNSAVKKHLDSLLRPAMFLVSVVAMLTGLPLTAASQSLAGAASAAGTATSTTNAQPDLSYVRPSQTTQLNNYIFDAFGPYPIAGSAIAAAVNQASDSPPEWHQGVEGYARRLGSDLGIAAIGTTTRYGLAEALKEDTLYYRCECTGVFPRLRHAVLSTLIARRGDDGHRVFSIPALIAPYAATMTAVYGWYPDRYSAKDAFRMGNYSMLAYMGGNVALEFLYSGPHSLLARMHLNNAHGAPDPGPNNSAPDSGTKN